jgi:uncharacterized membrane protein YfcA
LNTVEFTFLVWFGSMVAGFLGALTGLGGGVVIVPLLALALHVNIHYAMGASLVSVIATSSGAAAAYLKEGFSNIRVAMFLEMATTWGAIFGAFMVAKVSTPMIGVIFGAVLLLSAYLSSRPRKPDHMALEMGPVARVLRLDGSFPEGRGMRHYNVRRTPLGFAMMFVAGTLSGLLGIGSGAFKVLAMDQAMGIPFKVSTTTSNFMIGVTAAASAGVYLRHGYIEPGLAMPVMLGVLMGSFVGTRVLVSTHPNRLRIIFSLVIVALGVEMIYNGLTGKL